LVKQDFANPKHKKCLQATGLIAYKNTMQGAFYQRSGPSKIIFKDFKIIDNGLGVGVGMALPGSVEYNEGIEGHITDSKIYGESPAHDCPQAGKGGYCFKLDKCGLMAATYSRS